MKSWFAQTQKVDGLSSSVPRAEATHSAPKLERIIYSLKLKKNYLILLREWCILAELLTAPSPAINRLIWLFYIFLRGWLRWKQI